MSTCPVDGQCVIADTHCHALFYEIHNREYLALGNISEVYLSMIDWVQQEYNSLPGILLLQWWVVLTSLIMDNIQLTIRIFLLSEPIRHLHIISEPVNGSRACFEALFQYSLTTEDQIEMNNVTITEVGPLTCVGCPSFVKGEGRKKCARCRAVWYCGRPCQAEDWKEHRKICGKV